LGVIINLIFSFGLEITYFLGFRISLLLSPAISSKYQLWGKDTVFLIEIFSLLKFDLIKNDLLKISTSPLIVVIKSGRIVEIRLLCLC